MHIPSHQLHQPLRRQKIRKALCEVNRAVLVGKGGHFGEDGGGVGESLGECAYWEFVANLRGFWGMGFPMLRNCYVKRGLLKNDEFELKSSK